MKNVMEENAYYYALNAKKKKKGRNEGMGLESNTL